MAATFSLPWPLPLAVQTVQSALSGCLMSAAPDWPDDGSDEAKSPSDDSDVVVSVVSMAALSSAAAVANVAESLLKSQSMTVSTR